jgi:hypothetical protein
MILNDHHLQNAHPINQAQKKRQGAKRGERGRLFTLALDALHLAQFDRFRELPDYCRATAATCGCSDQRNDHDYRRGA